MTNTLLEPEKHSTPIQTILVECNLCGQPDYTVLTHGRDFEYGTCPDEFELVQCTHCHHVYLNPRPHVMELDTIYPEHYFPYHFDSLLNPLVKKARDIVQQSKAKAIQKYAGDHAKIIDIGCGGGAFLRILRDFGNKSWALFGNDFSNHAMASLQKQNFQALQGRFEALDLPPNSFDLITMNQVIEHLDDPDTVIKKIAMVLKPGGYIFIETPSLTGWDAKLFKHRYWGGYHFPRHWHLFTPQTLQTLLQKHGLHIVETTAMASPSFWVQSCHHYCSEQPLLKRFADFFDFRNALLMAIFTFIDIIQKPFNMTSNMRIIAQKAMH